MLVDNNINSPVLLVEGGPDHLQHTGIVPDQALDHSGWALYIVHSWVGGHSHTSSASRHLDLIHD